MHRADLTVVSNEKIAQDIFRLVLTSSEFRINGEPGQFFHLRCSPVLTPLLRRPISICDINEKENSLSLVFRTVGEGTKLLSRHKPGETIDALGPLGHGFPFRGRRAGERAYLIGGGIGVPPLYYLAKRLAEQKVTVTSLLGFAGKAQAFLAEEMQKFGRVEVATMDGSLGRQGTAIDLLSAMPEPDVVYACGPVPMLKSLQEFYAGRDIEAYISVEERMGCGIGACLVCKCRTNGQDGSLLYRKVCSDGPVFGLKEVSL